MNFISSRRILSSLAVSALVTASLSATELAAPVAGMGCMVGEVTSTTALVQVRLTQTDHLVDGDVPGAAGIVRFSLRMASVPDTERRMPVGFARTRPAEGPFVETDQGFMVPYRRKIPGTELVFSMTPIPGGKLPVGSPPDEDGRQEHEGPQVDVPVEPFWMGSCEVTWGEYKAYEGYRDIFRDQGVEVITDENRMDAVTAPTEVYDPACRYPGDERAMPNRPAVSMTQYAARQYTKWLSQLTGDFYRLPSEAEWEYACRAGSATAYHFGDDPSQLGDYAWYCDNADDDTHPVGRKRPNAWHLYDMHGNAGEWVLDQFDNRGFGRLKQSVIAGETPVAWPTSLHPRTVRGGSWDEEAAACRSASRMGSSEDWQEEDANLPRSPWWLAAGIQRQIGFRIARPLNVPEADSRSRYWDANVQSLRDDVDVRCFQDGRGYIGIVKQAE